MIEYYLEAASSYASDLDALVLLITVMVGFWFLLSEAVFFGFIWRFRRKPGVKPEYITGDEPELARWIHQPHYLIIVLDIFIIIGAARVWYDIKQNLPPAEEKVRVIAQQWAWTFVQPGPDRKLDTADDIKTVDELHVKANTVYHYELTATDVLHSFSVPVFRLKQDAIPGRVITGWFEATKTGEWDIQCTEICGIGHGIMGARIMIETPDQHAAWMAEHSSAPALAATAFGE